MLIVMHEMSLCESMLQTFEEQAKIQNYHSVKTVWLEIGSLAGVEIDALKFSFSSVMQGSLAAGASLEILEIQAQAWCENCARSVPVQQRYDLCPECGHYPLHIINGDQMRIKQLEVE